MNAAYLMALSQRIVARVRMRKRQRAAARFLGRCGTCLGRGSWEDGGIRVHCGACDGYGDFEHEHDHPAPREIVGLVGLEQRVTAILIESGFDNMTTRVVADALGEPLPRVAALLRSMANHGKIDGGRNQPAVGQRPSCWWAYFGASFQHSWMGDENGHTAERAELAQYLLASSSTDIEAEINDLERRFS